MVGEECLNCGRFTNASSSRLVRDACGHVKCRMCLLYEEEGCKLCENEHRIQMIGNFDYPGPSVTQAPDDIDTMDRQSAEVDIILQPLELVTNRTYDRVLNIMSEGNKPNHPRVSMIEQESSSSESSTCREDELEWFGNHHIISVGRNEDSFDDNENVTTATNNVLTIRSMKEETVNERLCQLARSNEDKKYGDLLKSDKMESDPLAIDHKTLESRTDIPKMEPSEMVSNIRSHLEGTKNQQELNSCRNKSPKNTTMDITREIEGEHLSHEKTQKTKRKKNPLPDRSHISIIPGPPQQFKCNICGRTFKTKIARRYHDACLTGVRPYKCTICNKSFIKQSHFEYHERMHSGYKPFECSFCGKAFPQRQKLNRHMHLHEAEKRYKCSVCDKRYSSRDALKSHSNIHTGVKPYSCSVCNKFFREATNLTRHMHTHSNERPHVCEQCGKSFKEKALLIRHRRTHGKDKPFSCSDCPRVFLSKSELSRHLSVHSDDKPFTCTFCNTLFRRKDNLNRHIRHHHSEDANKVKKPEVKLPVPQKNLKPQKSKSKPRRNSISLPKSPAKISVVYVNSRDQINSRLDSTGNITPIIRTIGEVSNAVPVINGPISIKKLQEKAVTPRKTFTYTEPIPLAEAVVINRRIEEKLYSRAMPSHDLHFQDYCSRVDRQLPIHKISPLRPNAQNRTNTTSTLLVPQRLYFETQTPALVNVNCVPAVTECNKLPETKEANFRVPVQTKDTTAPRYTVPKKRAIEELKAKPDPTEVQSGPARTLDSGTMIQERANCVPTITKAIHFIHTNETDDSDGNNLVIDESEPVEEKTTTVRRVEECVGSKKLSDIHWRRRTSEILKPRND